MNRDDVLRVAREVWGIESLRPMQAEAIEAGLSRRDSLVVMPTGGGKSLCYQVPPLLSGRTDVVVSPLIALMKDQVDGLKQNGYPAASLHSGMTAGQRSDALRELSAGRLRLVYVAPERLLGEGMLGALVRAGVSSFVIDEAHCISQWGHDFRPEYRRLAELRETFPGASLHAFTATATPRVRDDIVAQLGLRDPSVLIGRFDRANLTYRVLPKLDVHEQTLEAVRRHGGEAAIVYCLSRRDTEEMARRLIEKGVRAAHYHAGMEAEDRHRVQEDFASERLDVVVATVAFGMGVDRGDVRLIVHAAMPKTVEHYQQETGRAGRDGLPSECVLWYSASDTIRWERLMERSAAESGADPQVIAAQKSLLAEMRRYCVSMDCRHRLLSEYFGQSYSVPEGSGGPGCGACDACLGEVEGLEDGTVTAQKVLSAVARTQQRFGVGHVVDVLVGADTERVRRAGHQTLSTYGLLKELPKKAVTGYVYQLIDQGVLERTDGDRPLLRLNEQSLAVMRGQRAVRLMRSRAKEERPRASKADATSWQGVDRELFERLRRWRRALAERRGVPPFVILGDASLRDLARRKPTRIDQLAGVHGFGQKKTADLGPAVIGLIAEHGGGAAGGDDDNDGGGDDGPIDRPEG